MSLPRFGALVATALTPGVIAAPGAPTHPFGPPLTASVTAEGRVVAVAWSGAEDDWMAVGEVTGAFASVTSSTQTGAQVLAESPAVREYLLDHVRVSQDGTACAATWEQVEDVLEEGAHLAFSCPDTVAEVDVHVSVLTDVNDAYRTVVTSGSRQTLFTSAEPAHRLDLSATSGGTAVPLLVASAAGAAVVVTGVFWAAATRRLARSTR